MASSLSVRSSSFGQPNGHAKSWRNPRLSNTASTEVERTPQLFGRRTLTCRAATPTEHPGPGRLYYSILSCVQSLGTVLYIQTNYSSEKKRGSIPPKAHAKANAETPDIVPPPNGYVQGIAGFQDAVEVGDCSKLIQTP